MNENSTLHYFWNLFDLSKRKGLLLLIFGGPIFSLLGSAYRPENLPVILIGSEIN